ncbi:MAG: hypothetical protein H7A21_11645 [Spirochaetales bacterium]|nr:hypothetical protein [Leptospiraceae bacterium]MCP5482080.1 hypothetical protein [Spirochaetales bacterium]MCP5484964.1 hypothetical protein [Spirochaetales bacterium]
MKSGNCPKCKGRTIRTNRENQYGEDHMYLGTVGITAVRCLVYICCDCGYLEDYVEDKKALEKIRERWARV